MDAGFTTNNDFLKLWDGSSLMPIEGATGLTVNACLKAHNVPSASHLWMSVFKSGGDGGTATMQANRREIIEPGRCLLLIEYKDITAGEGGAETGGANMHSSSNPRAGMKATRCYYTKQTLLDALESMQSAKADQSLVFSPKDVDLVRFELFVQLAPSSRKIPAKSLIAIVDPASVPAGSEAMSTAGFASSAKRTPPPASAKSAKSTTSHPGDLGFSDLMSVGGKSATSRRPASLSGGLTSAVGGGGSLSSLVGLGVGEKRGRDGLSVSRGGDSQFAGGSDASAAGSPTLTDILNGGSSADLMFSGASEAASVAGAPGNPISSAQAAAAAKARQMMQETASQLKKQIKQPPLHVALPSRRGASSSNSTQLLLGDITWYRHHPHVLSSIIPPASGSSSRGGGGGSSSSSSKVAGFAVDGTLFTTKMNAESRGSDAFTLVHDHVPDNLKALDAHGYRIVLFASYPSLHHSSLFALQEKTERVVKFCHKYCPTLTITVVLSTVSSFQADSPFHMPKRGLWDYFVQYHNRELRPNPNLSFYCGNLFDPEILVVQAGGQKKPQDESLGVGKGNDNAENEGRWTYQSVEGGAGRMSTDSAATRSSLLVEDTSAKSSAEYDVDHSFAQAVGVKFIQHQEFYEKKGLPGVFS